MHLRCPIHKFVKRTLSCRLYCQRMRSHCRIFSAQVIKPCSIMEEVLPYKKKTLIHQNQLKTQLQPNPPNPYPMPLSPHQSQSLNKSPRATQSQAQAPKTGWRTPRSWHWFPREFKWRRIPNYSRSGMSLVLRVLRETRAMMLRINKFRSSHPKRK